MIYWAWPERSLLLLLIPALALFWWFSARRARARLRRFAGEALLRELAGEVDIPRRLLKAAMVLAALALGVAALLGPQWGSEWQEVKRRGADIIIALDVSRSMLAEDVRPNRLERAKLAISDLVRLLEGDRIGLAVFAGTAFLQCPLTGDYNTFLMSLEMADAGILPHGGTALAQAVRSSLRAFSEGSEGSRALVIITDGEDHQGDIDAVIKQARDAEVPIYTIGVGTPEGELIPARGEQGAGFVKDAQGRVVKSRLNEGVLRRIAEETGGSYLQARSAVFGLDELYRNRIAHLEDREFESRMQERRIHRYQWPLALALLMLLIEPLIRDTREAA